MKKIMFNDRYGLTRAVLEGRKTMTRRMEFGDEEQQLLSEADDVYTDADDVVAVFDTTDNVRLGVRYKVGEVVAVAQSYKSIFDEDCSRVKEGKTMFNITVNNACDHVGWTNKMFVRADQMPHRIRITGVRVERLQDISRDDCIKEGVGISATDNIIGYPLGFRFNYFLSEDKKGCRYMLPREAFAALIDKVSGRGTWERNPWVVVYEFELIK